MSVVSFFEKFTGSQRKRVQAIVANYRDLVARIAAGKEPPLEEVEVMLNVVAKSVNDLRQDVERYQHRSVLKERVASLPRLEAKAKEIKEKLATADRALEAAEKQHDDLTAPLYSTLQELKEAMSAASSAAAELFHTCDDPELVNEMKSITAELHQTYQQSQQARDRATYMEGKARTEDERAREELTQSAIDGRKDVAERYRQEVELARREEKRLDKQRVDLEKRRDQIEQKMRDY